MKTTFLAGWLAALALGGCLQAATLEEALNGFAGYRFGDSKKGLHEARMAAFRGADDAAVRREHEQRLLAFVRSDATREARRQACLWLGDLATESSVPVLEELAKEEGFSDVARIALGSIRERPPAAPNEPESDLGRFKAAVLASADPAGLLTEALMGEDDRKARLSFALIAQRAATEKACELLVGNIGKLKPGRQIPAMNVLLEVDADGKDAAISALVGSASGEVRLAAIRHLGAMGRKSDAEQLAKLLGDADESVVGAAFDGLRAVPEDTVMDALLGLLRSGKPTLQARGIELASLRGLGFAADELFRIAVDAENPNRKGATLALGRAAPTATFARLLKAFAKAEGQPSASDWAASVWWMARRQPDGGQAIRLMRSAASESPPKTAASIEAMAKKLEALQPAVPLDQVRNPPPFGGRFDGLRIPGRFDAIMPSRFEVAAYLDCGSQEKAEGHGMTITCLNGKPWNRLTGIDPSLSLVFAGDSLDFEVSGLHAETDYLLGMTWWDTDQQDRRQSLSINGEEVLPDTRALAYEAGKPTAARIQFALHPEHVRDGSLKLVIRRLAGPNAVCSELWIMKRCQSAAEKQVLLISGEDFPAHHWRETGPLLAGVLEQDPRLEVTICESPYAGGLAHLDAYDLVFVHFKNYEKTLPSTVAMQERLADYVREGGGLCLSHFACGAMEEWPDFVSLVGRVWNGEGHDRRGPFTVRVADKGHPVTRGLEDFATDDELYFCLKGEPGIRVLCAAHSKVKQADHPQAFVFEPGKGRAFVCTLGHDPKAYDAPQVRQLYRQGAAWAAGLDPES